VKHLEHIWNKSFIIIKKHSIKTQHKDSKLNFKTTFVVDVSPGIIRVKDIKKHLVTSQGGRLYKTVNTCYVEWRVC
jgi:hypothetical protein